MKILKLVLGVLCGLFCLKMALALLSAIWVVVLLVISGALCYTLLKSAFEEGRGPRIGY